ncbi:two component transcriptional regulator, LuxR family [Alkaliphilus metalliredigens QYMF]|uniref:Stage 0 sporulation protein A homolog n=1 Tax=Alkaliphilus metalliredigens (strain QYMF) TaxID=293826 RepID=A6TVR4_ALKMQ|nr:response regulator transcription factor [Alkaliphilus metalliredigens]ABR50282.1 two component transcriptional regulator, LuxR family [Alkaliphilus metalliredigens QYMF]
MKVLIVDDDALIRDSLKILIDLEADFTVVGTASNGQEAFEFCKEYAPDLILMDIRMPIMDGVLATKMIKESFGSIRIIILTTFKDDQYIKEALKNGAQGYILKSQSADSIIESLRTVSKGNVVFETEIASVLTSMLKEEKEKHHLDLQLTEREHEIIKWVGEGLSNREISAALYLSEGTVRNYVTQLLEKLNVRDRTQLAIFYLKYIQ